MNEMTSVATKGSWVTMIVKISAGSRGARRAQSAERRSAPSPRGGGVPSAGRSARSRVTLMPLLSGDSMPDGVVAARAPAGGGPSLHSLRLPRPVEGGDVVSELLSPVERVGDGHLSRDRRADVLGDLRAEIGELRDVDELDARRRARLDPRVVRVGAQDRLERGLGERRRLLDVRGVLVRRGTLARRHLRP